MSFKIEYFDGVSMKQTCKLSDDKLTTSTNQQVVFPSAGGELALKSDIPNELDVSNYATKTGTETLTNKTLTTPKIASIQNGNATLTIPSTTGTLATTSDIPDVSGYATESWVSNQNYLTSHQSLSDYAKKTDVLTQAAIINVIYPVNVVMFFVSTTDPNNLYTGTTWVKLSKGYYIKLDDSSLGTTGGSSTSGSTTLNSNQIPSHKHTFTGTTATGKLGGIGANVYDADTTTGVFSITPTSRTYPPNNNTTYNAFINYYATFADFSMTPAGTIGNTGGGQGHTHSLNPPFLTLCAWKRTA